MNKCEECHRIEATASYDVEGIASTMRLELCDVCAERHGLKERESVDELLARLGF